jgi:Lhr-like helicase
MRKIKLLNDLNFIWNRIETYKKMSEVNKTNFNALVKDYRKCAEDIMIAKQHNTVLNWVKNDKIENLEEIKNDLNEIMSYHTRLIDCFLVTVEHEKNFFCGNKN